MGFEWGIVNFTPCCSCLKRKPASIRASVENGGVLTSPCNQTIGFFFIIYIYNMSFLTYCQLNYETCPDLSSSSKVDSGLWTSWSSPEPPTFQPMLAIALYHCRPQSLHLLLSAIFLITAMYYRIPHAHNRPSEVLCLRLVRRFLTCCLIPPLPCSISSSWFLGWKII